MTAHETAIMRARATVRADRFWWWLLGSAAAGLALRLAWVAYAARPPVGLFDPARYANIADLIGKGKGYVEPFTVVHGQFSAPQASAYYPPGYPYFVGTFAWLIRHGVLPHDLPRVVGSAQALLGALTVVLLGVIGRRVWSPRAGVVAAVVLAAYPNLVMHSAALLGETLFIFLFMAAVAVLVTQGGPADSASAGPSVPLSRRRLVYAGVLFGLSVLVRPVSLAALPLLFLAWWLRGPGAKVALRQVGVLLACTVAVIAPWTIRNAVRMHAFVPISTNNGDNLCMSYAPDAVGVFTFSKRCITKDAQNQGSAAEVRHDHEATRLALRFLADDPGRVPWLVRQRMYHLVQGDDDALWAVQSYGYDPFIPRSRRRLLERLVQDSWWGVLASGSLGLLLLLVRGRRDRLVVGLAGLSTLVLPLLTFADSRFKVPFVPFLILGVGVLAAQVAASVGSLRERRRGAP